MDGMREKFALWSGAKDKLGLRVHGLIVGSPEKKRADPAVLRSLCSHTLPSGKNEVGPGLLFLSFCHYLVCGWQVIDIWRKTRSWSGTYLH